MFLVDELGLSIASKRNCLMLGHSQKGVYGVRYEGISGDLGGADFRILARTGLGMYWNVLFTSHNSCSQQRYS